MKRIETHHGKPLTDDGLYADNPNLMRTHTGRRIDPLNITSADIDIDDIAHSLARLCRYNGHCEGFISVARHSIFVANELEPHGPQIQLWGLLHDAAEAYLGDLIRPLKTRPEMTVFRRAELHVEHAVAVAFDLPWPMPTPVHEADTAVTLMELRELRDAEQRWDVYQDQASFLVLFRVFRRELDR